LDNLRRAVLRDRETQLMMTKETILDRVPKVIHYCWFSGDPMPKLVRQCIDTWRRVMPDYRLRVWGGDSFDFDSVPFVKQAFAAKKWAFVSDYVRLHALYEEGGVYLDSDVRVMKSFDPFLRYSFFTSHELHPVNFTQSEREKLGPDHRPRDPEALIYGLNVQAAIMGGCKGNEFLKDCLNHYKNKTFSSGSGKVLYSQIIGPDLSKIAERYGYRYEPVEQHLRDGMAIFPPEVFAGNGAHVNKETVALHLCNGSWSEWSELDAYEGFRYRFRNRYPALAPALAVSDRVVRVAKRAWGAFSS
jgi:hypothetical protein